jgi:hypothetical protein
VDEHEVRTILSERLEAETDRPLARGASEDGLPQPAGEGPDRGLVASAVLPMNDHPDGSDARLGDERGKGSREDEAPGERSILLGYTETPRRS